MAAICRDSTDSVNEDDSPLKPFFYSSRLGLRQTKRPHSSCLNPTRLDSIELNSGCIANTLKRECYNICRAELSSAKCKCWPQWMPYLRAYKGQVTRLCDHEYLRRNIGGASNRSSSPGKLKFIIDERASVHRRCHRAAATTSALLPQRAAIIRSTIIINIFIRTHYLCLLARFSRRR